MAAVHVRELDVVRGATHALWAVSLDVPEGRITGLLGPCGSGKTTLMRAIVGVPAVAFGLLGLDVAGSVVVAVLLAVCNALLGMSLGLFASAFAQSESQAVQFMPAFVLPQFLLCGLLVPRDRMSSLLEWISYVLPLTWAYDGLQRAVDGGDVSRIARDAGIVLGVTVLALALAPATLRRRTP